MQLWQLFGRLFIAWLEDRTKRALARQEQDDIEAAQHWARFR